MQSQLLSLSEIFNNTLFRIPDYQRGYAWSKKEYFDFWEDITRFSPNIQYYMGVITTDKIPNEKINQSPDYWLVESTGYTPFYIVDGQQRLTSLVILLTAIIHTAEDRNLTVINFTKLSSIKELFIAKPKGDSTIDYTALFNYSNNNSSKEFFEKNILLLPSTDEDKIVMNKYNQNLLDVYHYFLTKIEILSNADLCALYSKVTTKVVFNVYEINQDVNIFVTFETMNNRGKGLSTLELLKNRLIYISTLFTGNSKRNAPKLREEINGCWKKIYNYLGKNPRNMLPDDSFLMAHTVSYFSKEKRIGNHNYNQRFIDNGRLSQFLLDQKFTDKNVQSGNLSPDDIFRYISSLNSSIQIWYVLNFPLDERIAPIISKNIRIYLIKLASLESRIPRYHPNMLDWKNEVLFYFLKTPSEVSRLNFLEQLDRYYFIQGFFASAYSAYIPFFSLSHEIKSVIHNSNEDDPDKITQQIKMTIDKFVQTEQYKESISAICKELSITGFYKSGRAAFPTKHVLACYVIYLAEKSKEQMSLEDIYQLFFAITDEFQPTLEHIYPQKVSKTTNWNNYFNQYSQNQKNKIKNSIGNLVIINRKKNDRLSNASFKDKKEHGNVCFKNGSIDERTIARNNNWTLKEIKNRGLDIFNFINTNWEIKIPRDLRIDFIGLGKVVTR
ncbi:DUF262 domain-containing protein [Limosilactobacillus fermentum]|uniref:DUF262 domain-containing protein n=1 Tax=Limosilactobacillus fermentum TaxID=1613 RepID=UPI00209C3C69|nr:DUF262 domain-containing protein [Limosilactobacillus fermentum]MCO8299408.1 DUF262 domain-containing HNH endonuclease family protein [Limosilactobacillus fermentum]